MRAALRNARRATLEPRPGTLIMAVVVLAAVDWGSHLAGDSVVPGGPLDETAHLLTMLLVIWALGRGVAERLIIPALIASVAIDIDHIPQHLGTNALTAGTPRPYTHSLLTIVVVLALAATSPSRRRRQVLLGVALGLAVHFWRDLAESGAGVSLLWPVTDAPASLPHWSYVVIMLGLVGIIAAQLAGILTKGARHPSSELPPT